MQHKNKGTLHGRLFGENKSNLCPCSRVLQHFFSKVTLYARLMGQR